jgi:hypothetical protein
MFWSSVAVAVAVLTLVRVVPVVEHLNEATLR